MTARTAAGCRGRAGGGRRRRRGRGAGRRRAARCRGCGAATGAGRPARRGRRDHDRSARAAPAAKESAPEEAAAKATEAARAAHHHGTTTAAARNDRCGDIGRRDRNRRAAGRDGHGARRAHLGGGDGTAQQLFPGAVRSGPLGSHALFNDAGSHAAFRAGGFRHMDRTAAEQGPPDSTGTQLGHRHPYRHTASSFHCRPRRRANQIARPKPLPAFESAEPSPELNVINHKSQSRLGIISYLRWSGRLTSDPGTIRRQISGL